MGPTLEDFLADTWPKRLHSVYIFHPDFADLYLRRNDRFVTIDGKRYLCNRVVTVANVVANEKGNGSFTRLVKHLVDIGYAVCVECVLEDRFSQKLKSMGFVPSSSVEGARDFIFNFQDHLTPACIS